MKISYGITVCNEYEEIFQLIPHILQHKRVEDEIVVLVDLTKNTPDSQLLSYLHKLSSNNIITLVEDNFNNHFADWKNRLTKACTGDYIFQIDADEVPSVDLVKNLPYILENSDTQVILVPRVNTVEGLTEKHIKQWNWTVDTKGRINWPDYQWRIYKNDPKITWVNKVHEKLSGFSTFSDLPADEMWALEHHKDIERQERQNEFYNII